MKIISLRKNPEIYTCNSYLVLGTWNALGDVNTLIDAGTDAFVSMEIDETSTGVGKKRLEQIILTHNHFDHSGGVASLKKHYNAKILAFSPGQYVDELLKDGQFLQLGDKIFTVLYTPGHSNDSICLYCPEDKILFSGDTALHIRTSGGTYTPEYVESLERLCALDIQIIYPGHDVPMTENPMEMLKETFRNVRKSVIHYER